MIAKPAFPLAVLEVFDDPGVDFFGFNVNHMSHSVYLVTLASDDIALKPLHLGHHGKGYDLAGWDVSPSSQIIRKIRYGRARVNHGYIAVRCIRELKNRNIGSNKGLGYAVKYWAKHVSLTDTNENQVLSELEGIRLSQTPRERQVTAEQVTMVIEWLEVRNSSSVFYERRTHCV